MLCLVIMATSMGGHAIDPIDYVFTGSMIMQNVQYRVFFGYKEGPDQPEMLSIPPACSPAFAKNIEEYLISLKTENDLKAIIYNDMLESYSCDFGHAICHTSVHSS